MIGIYLYYIFSILTVITGLIGIGFLIYTFIRFIKSNEGIVKADAEAPDMEEAQDVETYNEV